MIGILLFELSIVFSLIGLWWYMTKRRHAHVLRKLAILFIGILLFEIMSEPMWINAGFQPWAFLYRDITWVLTLGWVVVFMVAILVVDYAAIGKSERQKFWLYLLLIETIVVPIESCLIIFGIRDYAPVLKSTMSGLTIPFTLVPLEAVFAVPLFAALIIAFYKYVNHLFEAR
jgi:hypothetical protein